MSTNAILDHQCEAWQPENPIPAPTRNDSSPHGEFLIEIYASFVYAARGEEDWQHYSSSTWRPTTYKLFRYSRHHLLHSTMSWGIISNMLSHVGVPYHVQPLMIRKIFEAARDISNAPRNKDVKSLPMIISIEVVMIPSVQEQESPHDMFLVSRNDDDTFSSIPSRIEAILALDRVSIQDGSRKPSCVICLDDISTGSMAIRMPCSHVYHEDCIVNWLQRSNICPLCRFKMPTIED